MSFPGVGFFVFYRHSGSRTVESAVAVAQNLLDVKTGALRKDPVILIDGERISAIGTALAILPGAEAHGLGNVT